MHKTDALFRRGQGTKDDEAAGSAAALRICAADAANTCGQPVNASSLGGAAIMAGTSTARSGGKAHLASDSRSSRHHWRQTLPTDTSSAATASFSAAGMPGRQRHRDHMPANSPSLPSPPAILLPGTQIVPSVVMDPIAVLRQCIRHFTAHPDYYGPDINALLHREVTHVLRVKASEAALATAESVDGTSGPLFEDADPLQALARAHDAPLLLPPLPAVSVRGRGAASAAAGVPGAGCPPVKIARGMGHSASNELADSARPPPADDDDVSAITTLGGTLKLQPPTPGLLALTRGPVVSARDMSTGDLPEAVHWGDGRGAAMAIPSGAHDTLPIASTSADGHNYENRVVVLDASGYEVTYLLGQLQQIEAAYNAKCVRLHELDEENKRLLGQLATADEMAARWQAACTTAQAQLEVTRRDLDGWRVRATDVTAMAFGAGGSAGGGGGRRGSVVRRAQANQLSEVKQEVTKLAQLWRETERALQESRRAFENTEQEARHSHDHLADAFHYIERLERRVARRDAYISIAARRQVSLEEKYEKLMWCFEELGAMTGAASYADYLLASDPTWTLALLVRLQRHVGFYSPLEPGRPTATGADTGLAATAATGPARKLTFAPSPGGARLLDEAYEPALVYAMMANDATAADARRGRQKRLCTNLLGTVGCYVLRWRKCFAIDFLGGEDAMQDSGELNRRWQPLLTLASLVLPLRRPDGSAIDDATAADGGASSTTTATTAATAATFPHVPNAANYDQTTIRFVLRAFWRERLEQYRRNMHRRVNLSIAAHERRRRREKRHARRASVATSEAPNDVSGADADVPENAEGGNRAADAYGAGFEQGRYGSTFLGALVAFVQQHVDAKGLDAKHSSPRYVVRGVAPRPSAVGKAVWDNGRVFFASILDPDVAVDADSSAKHQVSETASIPNTAATAIDRPTRTLSPAARELLCAIYYHTMELKDSDADFRLFYLVAHQLAPEMVGVNFLASLDAFEADCYDELRSALSGDEGSSANTKSAAPRNSRAVNASEPDASPNDSTTSLPFPSLHFNTPAAVTAFASTSTTVAGARSTGAAAASSSMLPSAARTRAAIVHSPLDALCRVAELVDRTPLAGEEDTLAPDSDGEGYGSILPGSVSTVVASPGQRKVRDASMNGSVGSRHKTGSAACNRPANPSVAPAMSTGGANTQVATTTTAAAAVLVHNIREYLEKLAERDQRPTPRKPTVAGGGAAVAAEGTASGGVTSSDLVSRRNSSTGLAGGGRPLRLHKEEDNVEVDSDGVPLVWAELDGRVRTALGPHAPLLHGFDERASSTNFFAQRRADRVRFGAVQGRQLAATRGLLPLPTVLRLLSKHLFATYAVTACGAPRFSLTGTLVAHGSSGDTADYPQLFAPVGQMPATEGHLKRLRFALALDQPAGLIKFTELFSFDEHTAAPTHLYDELLTLWLDLVEQQQCFFMDVVLRACASRHERFMFEGAEDCDGNVPISFLRKGIRGAFGELGIGMRESDTFVEHLIGYSKLLREEDDIQFEQFTDAPFYVNAIGLSSDSSIQSGSGDGAASRSGTFVGMSSGCNQETPGSGTTTTTGAATGGRIQVPDDQWDFQDESESCSLLHVALAVRMLYVVWGFDLVDATARLAATLAAIPLHVPFDTYRAQHHLQAQQLRRRLSEKQADRARSASTRTRSVSDCLPARIENASATLVENAAVTHANSSSSSQAARRRAYSLFLSDAPTRDAVLAVAVDDATKAAYTRALKQMASITGSANSIGDTTASTSVPPAAPEANPLRRAMLTQAVSEAGVTAVTPPTRGAMTTVPLYPSALPILGAAATSSHITSTGAAAAVATKSADDARAAKRSRRAAPSEQPASAMATIDSLDLSSALQEPTGDGALRTLARLAGLSFSAAVASHGATSGCKGASKGSRRAKKGGSAAAVSGGASSHEGVRACLAPLVAANLAAILRHRSGLATELQRPAETWVAVAASTDVPLTAEVTTDVRRRASFVPSHDVLIPSTGESSEITPTQVPVSRGDGNGTAVAKAALAPTNASHFQVDWWPPSEQGMVSIAAANAAAARDSSGSRPGRGKSLLVRGGAGQGPPLNTEPTVHVSLLHGTCAVLSLL